MAHKCINQNTNPEWLSCDKKLLLQIWAWWEDPLFLMEENRNYPSRHGYMFLTQCLPFLILEDILLLQYFFQDSTIFILSSFPLYFLCKYTGFILLTAYISETSFFFLTKLLVHIQHLNAATYVYISQSTPVLHICHTYQLLL